MREILCAVGLMLALAATPAADALMLAKDGKAMMDVVVSESIWGPMKTEVKELAVYLGRVVGEDAIIRSESTLRDSGGHIYVGATEFARKQGLNVEDLGAEEWVVRSAGRDLILIGGQPRGCLYAVYHFLEDEVGVHWWNPFEESVPHKPSLEIGQVDRRGKPVFRYRDIFMLYGNDGGRFAARNRLNREGDSPIAPAYGGEMGYGPPYHVHTFYKYFPPETYFKTHPEWFSLANGKRDADQKQLCLTNPELRKAFVEKLKAYIAEARETAAKEGKPAPTVFDISQNDWWGMCECPDCQAIAKAEESESGVLLDFLNYVADAIKTDCPDIYIDSLAYMMTQKPPKTIRPRDNIILRLCDTDSNFTKPITSQENSKFRNHLLSWATITKNLRIWNYAVTYAPYYGLPLPTVQTYPENYKFYAEHNVKGVFTEHEYPVLADLRDFKVWMMMKMLEDPYQDYSALMKTFTDGFYGAAGAIIRQYIEQLEKASDAKPSYLSMGASPRQYKYLDLDFVLAAQDLFDQAEGAVAADAVLLRHVRHARLPIDRASVVLFPDLQTQWVHRGHDAENLPLDRDKIAARVRETWSAQIDLRYLPAERAAARAEIDAELKPLTARPAFVALPEKFRGLPPGAVFDYTPDVTRNYQDQAKRVSDPEAECGMTNRLELSDEDMKKYALPMPWGLYDQINKKSGGTGAIHTEDVPGPGYHWYKMGEYSIGPSYYLYFFWSWIIQVDLENALDSEHPESKFEIWAKVKFEGGGFPHGNASDKNAICIERVVIKRID